jgi:hypothetical protein
MLGPIVNFLRSGGAITIFWHYPDSDRAVALSQAIEQCLADRPESLRRVALAACKEESTLPGVLLYRQGPSRDDHRAFVVQGRSAGRRGPLPRLRVARPDPLEISSETDRESKRST